MTNAFLNNFYIKALLRSAKICGCLSEGKTVINYLSHELICMNNISMYPYVWINNIIGEVHLTNRQKRKWQKCYSDMIMQQFINDIISYMHIKKSISVPKCTVMEHIKSYSVSSFLKNLYHMTSIKEIINLSR